MLKEKTQVRLEMILSLPRILLINFYYLPFDEAIKLPIRISRKIKIRSLGSRNSVKLLQANKQVSIGFEGSYSLGGGTGYWEIGRNASVTFGGSAALGRQVQFVCNGEMTIGDGFWCNAECIIIANERINIGKDMLVGWRCSIMDGAGHKIISEKQTKQNYVVVGDHVWLASNVTLLNGSQIDDGCVVASNGCITKKISGKNLLLGGINKILREDITWEK